ncbi:MAG: NAD(P)-dependent alcohol dehydrogenase [Deltaproteobacteria bacterium]|nr:NAD(P)-dependent alcohol dehydrogenase [Deltaproteobacteria bacterium]
MVATSCSAEEPLTLVELPSEPLGSRDVRVAVRAIGVNPVDWKMRSGGPLRLAHRILGPRGPLVVGVDFAGEVVEAAERADLRVGDRVVGGTDFSRKQLGSYASEVVVRDEQCAVLPASVSFEVAACLPVPGVTALTCLELGRVREASRVLVLGASGAVGLATLQLTRARGARAVGVCSTRNAALVERYGAIAVDYTKGDALAAAAPHGPYDLVVHAVGTATYPLRACRSLLTRRGVVALVVIRPADYPALAHRDVATVLGRPHRAVLEQLVSAVARGELETLVEEKIPLAEAERAHAMSRGGRVVGKLLLIP